MSAFYDATCKCGRRIGWHGKVSDRPACPRCGYRPDASELKADEDELEAFKELLRTKPTPHVCGTQRIAAGLTLTQAATRLGVTRAELFAIERGKLTLADSLAAKMSELYDMGPERGN